eukprot:COSAG01_NODE_1447_length_10278_cov_47.625209_16_plen_39_part_00
MQFLQSVGVWTECLRMHQLLMHELHKNYCWLLGETDGS